MSHHVSIRFRNYVLQVLHILGYILHIRLSFDKSPDLRYVPPHLFSLYIPLSGTLSNGMSHHVSIRFHNYVLQVLHTLDHILHIRLSSDKLPDLHCVQLSLFSLCTLLSGTLSNVMFHHVSTHFRNYVLQVLRIPGYTLHIRLSFDRLPDLHCVRLHLSFLHNLLSYILSNVYFHHASTQY